MEMMDVRSFFINGREMWVGVLYGKKLDGIVYSLDGREFLMERLEWLSSFLKRRGVHVGLESGYSEYPELVRDVVLGRVENEQAIGELSFRGVTGFERKVYEVLTDRVKRGEVVSYGALARVLGTSPRAIGGAMKRNPYPIIVPCHRVVSSDGLGYYTPKVEYKMFLLEIEGVKKWTD